MMLDKGLVSKKAIFLYGKNLHGYMHIIFSRKYKVIYGGFINSLYICLLFVKHNFFLNCQKKYFRNTIVSNSLNPDQARQKSSIAGRELCSNYIILLDSKKKSFKVFGRYCINADHERLTN